MRAHVSPGVPGEEGADVGALAAVLAAALKGGEGGEGGVVHGAHAALGGACLVGGAGRRGRPVRRELRRTRCTWRCGPAAEYVNKRNCPLVQFCLEKTNSRRAHRASKSRSAGFCTTGRGRWAAAGAAWAAGARRAAAATGRSRTGGSLQQGRMALAWVRGARLKPPPAWALAAPPGLPSRPRLSLLRAPLPHLSSRRRGWCPSRRPRASWGLRSGCRDSSARRCQKTAPGGTRLHGFGGGAGRRLGVQIPALCQQVATCWHMPSTALHAEPPGRTTGEPPQPSRRTSLSVKRRHAVHPFWRQ